MVRVAVIGAGIGGLGAAIALSSKGTSVDVYEQASALSEVGVGMHLGPNGSRILHRWGLADRLRAVGVRPAALEIRDHRTGAPLNRQSMGAAWEAEFGAPHYTLHRADLHGILAERMPAGALHLGHRLTEVDDSGEKVRLRFASGATATADVVVGADGVHSVLRQAVAGPDDAVFTGTAALRGLVPAGCCPDLPTDAVLVWPGPRSRLLCYPVRGGRQLTFVAVVPDAASGPESWSSAGGVTELAAAFEGWAPDVRAIVDAAGQVGRWTLYDREPLPRWRAGRTTLLGDAAHPMLPHHGQGASQAIEDAAVLAHCLAEAGNDVVAALDRYEAIRRPHTAQVQLGSRDGGSQRLGAPGQGRALVEDVSWVQRHDVEAELV